MTQLSVGAGAQDTAGDDGEDITPQEYRHAHRDEQAFRLASADVRVELLDDPRRARYTYACEVAATDGAAAAEWSFDIPSGEGEVQAVRAWDAEGNLQTRLGRADGKGARLSVRFRRLVSRGATYQFCYTYETSIRSMVARGSFRQTIMYGDWVIFSVRCDLLRIAVTLPSRSAMIAHVPAGNLVEDGGLVALRYEIHALRPLESFFFTVGYRRRKVGAPFYRWVASAIASGLIGALIASALEWF